jgi:hypothetical protein
MRLPLAIHTARQGYAWLNKGQHDFALLERFRKAIGKMPDIDYGEPLTCGALNVDEWVVVYRFMIEKGGDFRGRDCLYLSMTYFDRSVASSVNIAQLLESPFLAELLHEPPVYFEYAKEVSQPCPFDLETATSQERARLKFSMAGAAFNQPFHGTLRLTRYGHLQEETLCVQYLSERPMPIEAENGDLDTRLETQLKNSEAKTRPKLKKYEKILIALSVLVCLLVLLFKTAEFLTAFKRIEEHEFHTESLVPKPESYPWMNVHICWRTVKGFDDLHYDKKNCTYCNKGDDR